MTGSRILTERRGHILMMELNRPDKRNAADFELLSQLSLAYGELEHDPELRVGLVHARGDHFTGGLDLADVAPRLGQDGLNLVAEGGIDPWRMSGPALSKPVVVAVQGTCLTLGIELILASEVTIASETARFAQVEVGRGILPFGGATIRFPQAVGWGNAMRWILTGDWFDATEAHRIGLVQDVVANGTQLGSALAVAERIAAQAPLAVQAALANARLAARTGEDQARALLQPELVRLLGTEDSRIGMRAFLARSDAQFLGR